MREDANEPVRLTIYGDFNCPCSALASARAAYLEARSFAEIEWRAVEHDPDIPRAGQPVDAEARADFERELDQVRGLLVEGEADRLRVPDRRANTHLATVGFAATAEHLRPKLREQLFECYWTRDGGLTITGSPIPADTSGTGQETAARWRAAWLATSADPIVPTMLLADGYVSRGLGALSRLQLLADESHASS